ncbi:probable dolichyl-diphosphooligosaccharide--protein glycosyltransferase subunit 3B [Solanum lycopersicum]|nr:probable dolichyl-diphosphooligosaccharide--protein glycosyltransferase subunit 3B [Solanum lycopersicum]
MHETWKSTMAISTIQSSFLLITILFLLSPITTHSNSSDDVLSELIHLRSKSPLGLIHLKDPLLQRILSIPSPKPFSSLIFFDARQLHSKPDNSIPSIKYEFSLLSSSFLTNNPQNNTQIFFFIIEFQESKSSFELFDVQALPHIRLIPIYVTDVKTDCIKMDASGYSMGADSMKEFVEMNADVNLGPIHAPPFIPKKMMMIIGAGFLIWSPFLVKKFVIGNTHLQNKYIWMVASILLYFFSVSGTMYTIIRKAPLFLIDRNDPGKYHIFYQGSGMQLGAEGFAVGFLYTIVGLLLALMTHVLLHLKNRGTQSLLMALGLFVSFWAVKRVIYLNNWKTGYGVHAYWPSGWM